MTVYILKCYAVLQANECEKSKREFRHCRENLFQNMLKQGKYEEVLSLYIEICKFQIFTNGFYLIYLACITFL